MTAAKDRQFQELPLGVDLVASFGTYRVQSGIAIGRCCEVYDGENCTTGEEVALKVFRRHQEYKGALQRELYFLHALGTPGSPVVKHFGELQWEGRDVLVQELLSHTVRDIFLYYEDSACSPWFIITLATHIFRGLKHLHSNGVVHADLKPPNVLWDAHTAAFKLIDFGVSFTSSENIFHAVQSKGYQAPECMQWNNTISDMTESTSPPERPGPPADIWSAGCIIAESLTRRQLFPGSCKYENTTDMVRSALTSASSNYSQEFLKEACSFITRCLQISPEKRADARDLLCDPWLTHPCRPSFDDLVLLPTPVLRIFNVMDANSPEAANIEECILDLCKKYGEVCRHHIERTLGNFYVRYKSASAAEIASSFISELVFKDKTLIVTFYPPDSWENEEFY